MIDRQYFNGPINLCCDGCAHGVNETGAKDFQEALVTAKSEGWAVRHCGAGQGWCHFCPDCVEARVWEEASDDLRRDWGRGK